MAADLGMTWRTNRTGAAGFSPWSQPRSVWG